MNDLAVRLLCGTTSFFAALVLALLMIASEAGATGTGCGLFTSCPHSHDYCRFVSITSSICTERGDGAESCTGLGQGTCKSGLVCDFLQGECRHEPGQTGELCSILLPCTSSLVCTSGRCGPRRGPRQSCTGLGQGTCQSGLVCDFLGECRHVPGEIGEYCGAGVPCISSLGCSADVGGRCEARDAAGEVCSGIGQGSCRAGLVCDANRICRHDPPIGGEACGIGVGCASAFYCSSPIAGQCQPRAGSQEICTGLGQGTCQAGLLCDFLGECRHVPGEFGEFCGAGVPCIDSLGCSADVGGRCEERDTAGEVCSGIGQGSCQAGLVCDFDRTCRHDPPQLGEPCGTGVPCIASLGCSAEIAGVCEERDSAGETCSGIGQGSCEAGLVCDFLRVCRHTPPQVNEPCGIGVECVAGLFCQGITQVCKVLKTAGEGCSAFNPCRAGLSCDLCLTETCNHPLQCFPNANEGAITQQQCNALYSSALHQAARDINTAMTYGAGDAAAAVVAESQEFGVVYGPDDRYGCFTTLCGGIELNVELSIFVSLGFYNDYDSVAGSSTSFVESASIGPVSFSTSQIFERFSLNPFDIGGFIGTEDCLAIGVSPDLGLIPLSAGVYVCETIVDTVLVPSFCGDGTVDGDEMCDDGNVVNGDGCSSSCATELLCGNGNINTGEGCDDGNRVDGDGCSAGCTLEPFCGDGDMGTDEDCDDANNLDGDGCSAVCTLECEPGDCALDAVCPNGIVEAMEACDDGNAINFDGCNANCEVEEGEELLCDVDGDGDVDRDDTAVIFEARGEVATGLDDPRDGDGDGLITVQDGRVCALECTNGGCEPSLEPECGMLGIEPLLLVGWLLRRARRGRTLNGHSAGPDVRG